MRNKISADILLPDPPINFSPEKFSEDDGARKRGRQKGWPVFGVAPTPTLPRKREREGVACHLKKAQQPLLPIA